MNTENTDASMEQSPSPQGRVQAFVGWYYTRLWEACITCGLLLKRVGNKLLDAGWGIGDYAAHNYYPKTPEGKKVIPALRKAHFEHQASPDCPCDPDEIEPGLWVHRKPN